jgi:hypothetical protein
MKSDCFERTAGLCALADSGDEGGHVRPPTSYDHRLRELACEDGSAHLLGGIGVPRSTAASWLRRGPRAVVTLDVATKDTIELQAEVIRLRQRNEVLSAIVRLLFMLRRLAGVRLDETRIPDGAAKAKILTAIARARATLARVARRHIRSFSLPPTTAGPL